jgi:hypothetical protein
LLYILRYSGIARLLEKYQLFNRESENIMRPERSRAHIWKNKMWKRGV